MPKITVTVTGLDKTQLKLDRYHGPLLDKALGKATIAAGRTMVKPMRVAAPVAKKAHTGKYARPPGGLRKSIKATRARRGDKPGAIVGPRVWYRHFVVGGTANGAKANPFVTRVASATQGTASRAFDSTLHAELNR